MIINSLDIDQIIRIAKEAGGIIMSYYGNGCEVSFKKDNSPVTNADIAANNFIFDELTKISEDIPIIAEENIPELNQKSITDNLFWLIDPIDGTKGFISCDDQFTVNIALIKNLKPFLGVIYAPALGELYYADGLGNSYKIQDKNPTKILLKSKKIISHELDVLVSNSRDDGLSLLVKRNYIINSTHPVGSSLKLCYIAEGRADAYSRVGLTMEWDIAAGDAILQAAGGQILDLNDDVMTYGKPQFKNPSFIAFGNRCNNL